MKELIEEFYWAFQAKDAERMVDCYHDDIVFTDPAFGTLRGERAKNMWRMLLKNDNGLKLDFSDVEVNEKTGKAHWEAHYTFSQTGRKVVNKIDATFEFEDGKICKHIDNFNLHAWAKQALGFKGALFGGTQFFKNQLNAKTNHLLTKFEGQ